MKKCLFTIPITLLLLINLQVSSQSEDTLILVTDKLYMISGLGGNATFLVTDEGVLLIDAGTVPTHGVKIKKHIKSVTDQPIKYLIYTHYHRDHTFGTCGIDEDMIIIGHSNAAKNLKSFGSSSFTMYRDERLPKAIEELKNEADSLKKSNDPRWEEANENYQNHVKRLEEARKTKIVYPDITFEKKMTLYMGEDTIDLFYPGPTHTNGNILVEFENRNAVVTGDFLFNSAFPYIDLIAGCDTKNWIEQIRILAEKEFKYIIPGHNDLATNEQLLREGSYLKDLRKAVQAKIDENKSLEEIQKEITMDEYADFGFQRMLKRNIAAVYNELTTK